MCIGIPMQVLTLNGRWADCGHGDERRTVDLSLVGPQAAGTWVLVFLDSAREVLSPERAQDIRAALAGLAAAMRGESPDAFFADLLDREPQLPEFLRTQGERS